MARYETAVQCANRLCEAERLELIRKCDQLILRCKQELILREINNGEV